MSDCSNGDKKKSVYTGGQVGDLNFTGDFNFVAGGTPGSGLSAGKTMVQTIGNGLSRRPWLRNDAKMDDRLLDAAYPSIELQWFVEIDLEPGSFFRLSDKPFYVQDSTGASRYYDPRIAQPPTIQVTVGEWLQPNYEVSDASFQLNNRDGYFNDYLPGGSKYKNWSAAKVKVKVGFGEKYSNYETIFEGQVTVTSGLTSDRDTITVKAYDRLDLDEVPMPPRTFTVDSFPEVDSAYVGKGIPLVYGDWTNNVPTSGSLNAVCLNAGELNPGVFVFKISDAPLASVTEMWLHRGQRKEGEAGGPIQIDMTKVNLLLSDGIVTIPKGVDVLLSEISYGSGTTTAGAGSGLDLLAAADTTVNFVDQRIQVGDKVIKRATGETGFVTAVSQTVLNLTGGVVFATGEEYTILTRKYAFLRSDKVTVKAVGKPLGLSTTRISEITSLIKKPSGIGFSVFDRTLWICDNDSKALYNVNFDRKVLQTIPYAQVDSALSEVSSISVGADNKLFITSKQMSRVWRYDPVSLGVGFTYATSEIIGIDSALSDLTGVAAQADNLFWLYDDDSGDFWLVDAFSATQPFVATTFNRSMFGASSGITDVAYDEVHRQLVVFDGSLRTVFRISETDGTVASSFSSEVLVPYNSQVTGLAVAQDESVFYVDAATLVITNYNEQTDASTNPAFIARDLLEKYGNHTYEEFDISWNSTARQLSVYQCRAALAEGSNLITYINKLLAQFNVVFHQRFGLFSLFYIDFQNFRTNGRLVTEKDIKDNSFKPQKETNQYFNSVTANYSLRPYDNSKSISDTYVSPAGVSFAGREVSKSIDLPNVYRREDLDRLLPLLVKLSVPEPEFVDVTMGFRLLRTQMHDFLTVDFDGDQNCATGIKDSGRRYNHVPCMVRQLKYSLTDMTISMKLWSLLGTRFPGWEPPGRTVGGENDSVVLSNLGRLGRFSPRELIESSPSTNQLKLSLSDGLDVEHRSAGVAGKCWLPTHRVALVDGATKEVIQTLTIQSISGQVLTFAEELDVTPTPTVTNSAGFVIGGHYIQYASYDKASSIQKAQFASYSPPVDNYPSTNTFELEEQRSGKHNFADGGVPYLIYPIDFTEY